MSTRGTRRRVNGVQRFFATYGWRAYAVPLLVLMLIVSISQLVQPTGDDTDSHGTGHASGLIVSDRDSQRDRGYPMLDGGVRSPHDVHDHSDVHGHFDGHEGDGSIGAPPSSSGGFDPNLPAGTLPAGGPYTTDGSGDWRIVPGGTERVGSPEGRTFRYTVEIENGVDTTSYGGDEAFARMVDETLANPKSWSADPRFAFQRISDPADGVPDFRVSLTSSMTVRETCGYTIQLEVSCYNPLIGRAIINDARWVRGSTSFQGDIGSYRQYVINHEVGHGIGYPDHVPCEADGALANVMMQQTLSTANNDIAELDPNGVVPPDGLVCRYNPWPYPHVE